MFIEKRMWWGSWTAQNMQHAGNISNWHWLRHNIANVSSNQPCLTENDYRDLQCAAFNSKPYRDRYYEWKAYIDPTDPCSLTCKAKGLNFVAKLASQVKDGTRCRLGSLDMCVAGKCLVSEVHNPLNWPSHLWHFTFCCWLERGLWSTAWLHPKSGWVRNMWGWWTIMQNRALHLDTQVLLQLFALLQRRYVLTYVTIVN